MIERYLTCPEIAKQLRVNLSTVHGWIHNGELAAFNCAPKGAKRPRWKISPASLEAFIQSRSNEKTEAKPTRKRKRRSESVIEFF